MQVEVSVKDKKKAERDAPGINRIVDRFQFASVAEAAKIKTEIERTYAEKAKVGKSEKQEKKLEKVQVHQEKQRKIIRRNSRRIRLWMSCLESR